MLGEKKNTTNKNTDASVVSSKKIFTKQDSPVYKTGRAAFEEVPDPLGCPLIGCASFFLCSFFSWVKQKNIYQTGF
jgi:hypothetical protein